MVHAWCARPWGGNHRRSFIMLEHALYCHPNIWKLFISLGNGSISGTIDACRPTKYRGAHIFKHAVLFSVIRYNWRTHMGITAEGFVLVYFWESGLCPIPRGLEKDSAHSVWILWRRTIFREKKDFSCMNLCHFWWNVPVEMSLVPLNKGIPYMNHANRFGNCLAGIKVER